MSDLIETWKNDFRAFVNSLNLSRDDYKTMMEYIDEIPAVQPDHVADIGRKVSISCGQEKDLISRQMAIDAVEKAKMAQTPDGEIFVAKYNAEMNIQLLPTVQPDRDVIDDCLCHIYKNISVHTATGGVIAIKYYMEKLYEEIYGEGERPWWMT